MCPEGHECDVLWEQTCSGANGFKICGFDPATGCRKLSPFVACAASNTCVDGECSGPCIVPEVMLLVDRSSSMVDQKLWDFTRQPEVD